MKRRMLLTRTLLLAALAATAAGSLAQQYPDRPLRLMVPFAASGGADLVARIVAERLAKQLGQQVLVENKPGAGGTIAADFVAKSQPDGYTLLYGTPGVQIVNPYLMKKLPYDPARDFAPIVQLVIVQKILVVHPAVPAKSVKELIELGRAQPGTINYGSAGIGASSHLSGEQFAAAAGIRLVHVPYKGTGPALQDLLAGNIQMAIDSIPVFMPYVKSGALRALAVTTLERSPLYPELPTVADTLPGYESYSMNYLTAPAMTPRAIIDRLNREANAVLRMNDVRERLLGLGITPAGGTPEELEKVIRSEAQKWKKVIEISGAKAD